AHQQRRNDDGGRVRGEHARPHRVPRVRDIRGPGDQGGIHRAVVRPGARARRGEPVRGGRGEEHEAVVQHELQQPEERDEPPGARTKARGGAARRGGQRAQDEQAQSRGQVATTPGVRDRGEGERGGRQQDRAHHARYLLLLGVHARHLSRGLSTGSTAGHGRSPISHRRSTVTARRYRVVSSAGAGVCGRSGVARGRRWARTTVTATATTKRTSPVQTITWVTLSPAPSAPGVRPPSRPVAVTSRTTTIVAETARRPTQRPTVSSTDRPGVRAGARSRTRSSPATGSCRSQIVVRNAPSYQTFVPYSRVCHTLSTYTTMIEACSACHTRGPIHRRA